MSNIKGYKVFNPDWTCRGFKYEVGKTFKHEGDIGLCSSGFHFCQKASDCFNYYNFNSNNKVAEVLATGLVETENDKSVTNEITIVREIPWQELLTIVNIGSNCTGLNNTGDRNTGNCNTGYYNTGNYNTGNCNTGNWNTGDRNTGYCNTGYYNTGYYNTGNRNTGDCNTGDCNTGVFCTNTEKIKFFNKESDITYSEWMNYKARQIIKWNIETTVWIYEKNMSEEEKEKYPKYKTTGGYLKKFSYKEAWENLWNNITEEEKEEIKKIPNFDKDIFKEITGIEV